MFNDDMFLLLIPLAVFAVAAGIAFLLGKNKSQPGMIALVLAWLGFTGAMFLGMEQASGFDGLGYVVGLIGISAPVGAGLVIGGPIGWLKKEKTLDA